MNHAKLPAVVWVADEELDMGDLDTAVLACLS